MAGTIESAGQREKKMGGTRGKKRESHTHTHTQRRKEDE